ncbi:MAG: response regulator, partial [Proteobacteria bacterium]|nr:response regulator [Pseudomonadota bacterium]
MSALVGAPPVHILMAVEKILVVDDEPFIRKTFEEVLRGKRYGVSSAGSIAEAERLMKKEEF